MDAEGGAGAGAASAGECAEQADLIIALRRPERTRHRVSEGGRRCASRRPARSAGVEPRTDDRTSCVRCAGRPPSTSGAIRRRVSGAPPCRPSAQPQGRTSRGATARGPGRLAERQRSQWPGKARLTGAERQRSRGSSDEASYETIPEARPRPTRAVGGAPEHRPSVSLLEVSTTSGMAPPATAWRCKKIDEPTAIYSLRQGGPTTLSRPVACEHAAGPVLFLSGAGDVRLRRVDVSTLFVPSRFLRGLDIVLDFPKHCVDTVVTLSDTLL